MIDENSERPRLHFSFFFACFNYKDLLRGESGELWRYRIFSFFFCIYLLGGSASPPLASRWYLWPPCRFSPKQSIKQIDPVHIVQHMGKTYFAWNYVLFSHCLLLFFLFHSDYRKVIRKRSGVVSHLVFAARERKEKENNKIGNISRGDTRRSSLDCPTQFAYFECTRVFLFCAKSLTTDNRESLICTTRTRINTLQNSSQRCIANSNHTKTVPSGMSNEKIPMKAGA